MKRNPAALHRALFYLLGLGLLALGLTLNTKAGLGVSPIISVAYCYSEITGVGFGDMTFVEYALFVLVEMALHTIAFRRAAPDKRPLRVTLALDALQLPLSLVFTRFLNLFSARLPDFSGGSFAAQLVCLLLALTLTGIGAAMSLDMRLIPNPGDGIVQAIADFTGRSTGLTKNCFDLLNITITIVSSLLLRGRLIGVGLGTVIAVIAVGRVIALFNYLFRAPLVRACGLD